MTSKVVSSGHGVGAELAAIRAVARLSQEALHRLSGVSRNTIGAIERDEWQAKPSTLRALADGAATDGAGNPDQAKADAYYDRLMRAAGYIEDAPSEPPSKPRPVEDLTDEEVVEALTGHSKDPTISVALLATAQDWPDLDPSAQRFLLWSIEETKRRDAEIKAQDRRIREMQRGRRTSS